jgi:PAS domain S-box-containing protein
MPNKNLNILMVEDSEDDATLIERKLRKNGYNLNLKRAEDRKQMERAIKENKWDLIISDYILPRFSGREALKLAQEKLDGVPLILVSGKIGETVAVEMLKQGASDFVMKDNLTRLPNAVKHALKDAQMVKEKRKTDEELKKMVFRYKLLSKNISDIIWTIDKDKKFTYVSPSILKITGYKTHELLNKQPEEVLVPEHRQIVLDAFDQVKEIIKNRKFSELPKNELEVKLICKNGSVIWTGTKVSVLLDQEKKLLGFLGVTRDITGRKKIEVQSLEMQKMEALGTLAGGIAHDFNNILMPVIINSELLLSEASQNTTQHLYLEQILEAGKRGKALIKQILTYSRHSDLEKKTMDVVPLVKDFIPFLKPSLPSNIRVEQAFASSHYIVNADQVQIQQVLMNLFQNARDAIGNEDGTIHLQVSEIRINPENQALYPGLEPGPYVDISVKDTGCGIDRENVKRVFDPFFTTKRPEKGSGMGLPVSMRIIKNHQGHITFSSEIDKGSSVHVYLPLSENPPMIQECEDESIPGGTEKLMLVEDEKEVALNLKNMLGKLGYKVTAAHQPQKALRMLREEKKAFDLMIVDQVMSGMTGIQLVHELRQLEIHIPVILISGYLEPGHTQKAKAAGIEKLMVKPIHTRDMAQAIRNILDSLFDF